jgi:hypothetical protein
MPKLTVRSEIHTKIPFVINLNVIHPHCVYIITGRKIYATGRGLRHCITSREVAGSIPDGVTEIFL